MYYYAADICRSVWMYVLLIVNLVNKFTCPHRLIKLWRTIQCQAEPRRPSPAACQDRANDIQVNNYTSTHLPIRPTSGPNFITSSPLQRPLSPSRCCMGPGLFSAVARSATPLRPFGTLYLLTSLTILATCFYLVFNAASKRISTNFHFWPSHKRCAQYTWVPAIRF